MPSKGQIQAEREAAARRSAARTSVELAVREALDAGISADDVAKMFARVLRDRGLLGTADDVIGAARTARKRGAP